MDTQKPVIVIPARLNSKRFPEKLLADLNGKPFLQHVYERALSVPEIGRVVVATDSPKIFEMLHQLGGEVKMTSADHLTGTDRIAEVVSKYVSEDVIVNVQGDLLLLDPPMVSQALIPFQSGSSGCVMSTLKKPIQTREELMSPHVVKVVTDHNGRALYFSRSPIPYSRDMKPEDGISKKQYFKHYGLYVYRRTFLLKYVTLPIGVLESLENLEQLRALENGYPIDVVETAYDTAEVDTPEDLERIKSRV